MERLKVIKRLVSLSQNLCLLSPSVSSVHNLSFLSSSTSCRSITTRLSSSCPPTSKLWQRTPRRTRCEALQTSLFYFFKVSFVPLLRFSSSNTVWLCRCFSRLSDGAQEPGHRVRPHSGAHHRGQHDPHGDAHAGPVQDRGDAHPECERRCFGKCFFFF